MTNETFYFQASVPWGHYYFELYRLCRFEEMIFAAFKLKFYLFLSPDFGTILYAIWSTRYFMSFLHSLFHS